MTSPVLHWFRRDLRVHDNEALLGALRQGPVLPVFVLDPVLVRRSHRRRLAALACALGDLDASLDGALEIRLGDPAVLLPDLAREVGASSVVVTAELNPWGATRDRAVAAALKAGPSPVTPLTLGSPYLRPPGSVARPGGRAHHSFTSYYQDWQASARREVPLPAAPADSFLRLGGEGSRRARDAVLSWADPALLHVPVSETQAAAHLEVVAERARYYHEDRDRADLPGTTNLSAALKYGTVHPRTVQAGALKHGTGPGAQALVRQLAWRDFNATLLRLHPTMLRHPLDPGFAALATDSGPSADELFRRWCAGTTGFPFVDAAMRELAATGLVHTRARLVAASFLVKDLHLPWQRGERFFAHHLLDHDTASNAANWQWAAGCGVDASPFFRVLNPVTQGERADPDGGYVRRWVLELAHLPGASALAPWDTLDGYAHGYPERVVDHARARQEALRRFEALTH